MESDDRVGAAYHEAGHAVVAWVLGLPVGGIAIAIGGDEAAGGANIGTADHLSICEQVTVCVAGLEAQEVFEAPTHDQAGLADYAKVISILGEMLEKESCEIRNAARHRARDIILANKAIVIRLAKHLIENGRVSDSEFLDLIAS